MGNFILGTITGIVLFVLLVYVTCKFTENWKKLEKIYKKYKEYE